MFASKKTKMFEFPTVGSTITMLKQQLIGKVYSKIVVLLLNNLKLTENLGENIL